MRTYFLNSKKCLTCNSFLALALVLFSLAAEAKPEISSGISQEIQNDIQAHHELSFKSLLTGWEKKYGVKAVQPLIKIAGNTKIADPHRYIALMGAVKLGGIAATHSLKPFFKDPSWMMRVAALRSLRIAPSIEQPAPVFKMLKDPALVVRYEAVLTLEKMHPEGTIPALVSSLDDPLNYHNGKAEWIPHRILEALVTMKAPKSVAKDLKPLLDKKQDTALLRKTVQTLERITGKNLGKSNDLLAQAALWSAELGKKN